MCLKGYESPMDPKDRKKVLAQMLKELRKKNGVTQKNVGDAIGCTANTVAIWESGNTEPNAEMLVRLSYFFDVSLDVLCGRSITAVPTKEGISDIFEQYGGKISELQGQVAEADNIDPLMKKQMEEALKGLQSLMDLGRTINDQREDK